MDDPDNEKRKVLQLRYEKLRRKVKDWEVAIYKAEGRKPNENDMKQAPKDVQISYREYTKIRKYLENSKNIVPAKHAKQLTPGKIFMGDRRFLQQRTRSELSQSKTPLKMFRKSDPSRKPETKVASLGFRPARSKAAGSPETSPYNRKEAPFKKLFSLAISSDKQQKAKTEEKHQLFVDPEKVSGAAVELSPNSTRLKELPFTSRAFNSAFSKPGTSKLDALQDSLEAFPTTVEKESNSVPLFKRKDQLLEKEKQQKRSSFSIDSGWLARVAADDELLEEDRKENTTVQAPGLRSANTSGSDDGIGLKSPNSDRDKANHSSESLPMDLDPEIYQNQQFNSTSFEIVASKGGSVIRKENTDSGICDSGLFNAAEVQQAIQEVISETGPLGNSSSISMSDADGSLLYSFTEDACLPSDHEDEPALDQSTMSNILQTLTDTIDGNEMDSPNQEEGQGKKRRAMFAFSPSPTKAKPRKFFKSSRGDRARPNFTGISYKPVSPVKKIRKKAYDTMYKAGASPSVPKITLVAVSDVEKTWALKTAMSETEDKDKPKASVPAKDAAKPSVSSRAGLKRKKAVNYTEDNEEDEKAAPKPTIKRKVVIDVFDEAAASTTGGGRTAKKGRRGKESLESKMNRGGVHENYVRIDTKKKVFVRGHRKVNVTKLKKQDWRNRKRMQAYETKAGTKDFTCHKCGEKGHFAKFCTKGNKSEITADEIPEELQDNSPYPTLVEAAMMVYKGNTGTTGNRVNIYTTKNTNQLEETQLMEVQSEDQEQTTAVTAEAPVPLDYGALPTPQLILSVDPVFNEDEDMSCDPAFQEETMLEGLREFGYDGFRPGQKETVLRVLKGLSTLVILSTGTGKSLCYQLPAYLYAQKYPGALTLCISPLVSLMEDQIQGIPAFLNAACIHSNMTAKQKETVMDKIKARKLNVLLVSPEAVCGGLFGLLRGNSDSLPKISFACIDEVHCVSQWSHNFRPSYLQLCKILRDKLNVKTILGLTATATKSTADSICEHLGIDPSTTIRGELIPGNLQLSVSRDLYKDESLMRLLRGERFCECDSIIIYCTRREECERIATLVRTNLQEFRQQGVFKTKGGARLSGNCEAYHAGMPGRRRKNVQDGFMSGSIRIVVATVAFGMGIDKSDIRAVIHYNMPSAFESYVQEIGRAGRDGLPAHCHLFLDTTNRKDLRELKRHVYANSVDRPTVRRLLRKVFQPCKCKRIQQLKGNTPTESVPCQGHEVSFSIDKCVNDLDLPKENITTLLCYLELGQRKWIDILPLTYEMCKIQSYGGPKALKAAASRCPPLAVAIALQQEKKNFFETDTCIEFNVIEAAATVGWNSNVVKKELKNLEWAPSQYDDKGNPTRFRKSGLMVEFTDLAYRVRSQGSLSDEDADDALNYLHGRNLSQERTQLHQLNRVYHALLSVSFPNINNLCDTFDEEKSDQLKKFIHEYFSEDANAEMESASQAAMEDMNPEPDRVEDLRRSIRSLVDSNRDTFFTTRAVARIFQGISSPCFPADIWYRNRDFWRRYLDLDFHFICNIAAEEL